MSANKSKIKKRDANQMMFELFEKVERVLALEGGSQDNLSDFEFHFRVLLKDVLDETGRRAIEPLDRAEIAVRMTAKLGREITKAAIDNWVAMSAVQKRIHVDALKALCEVIGDYRPLHFFVESCGFTALAKEEAIYAEYGFQMMMKRMIDTDIKGTLSKADEGALRKLMVQRINKGDM